MSNKKPQGFFCKGKFHHQQQYINLFVKKHKIDIQVIIDSLLEFGKNYGSPNNRQILNMSRSHFDEFLSIVTNKTGVVFKKRPRYIKKKYDYDSWFERASLDGTLAYNGVADDF